NIINPHGERTGIEQALIFLPFLFYLFFVVFSLRNVFKINQQAASGWESSSLDPYIKLGRIFFKSNFNIIVHRPLLFAVKFTRNPSIESYTMVHSNDSDAGQAGFTIGFFIPLSQCPVSIYSKTRVGNAFQYIGYLLCVWNVFIKNGKQCLFCFCKVYDNK